MPKFQPGDWVSLSPVSDYLRETWNSRFNGVQVVRVTRMDPYIRTNYVLDGDKMNSGWHPSHLILSKPAGPPETTREMSYKLLREAGYA